LASKRQYFFSQNAVTRDFQNHNAAHPLHNQHQQRQISTILPEVFQGFSIWGGSGILLQFFHMNGAVPYWACFSLCNLLVRISLFPLVIYSAHTAARFGKVAAEIQFLVSIFQNDYKATKAAGADSRTLGALMRMGLQSLRGVYKLHNINPLAAFLSPLLQIPFFIYMSIDLRKLVNGRDPELAQELTDCGSSALWWIGDLTEPDPYFALPVLAGVAMYMNLETALGKRNLAGEAAAKADTGLLLKDLFQSVAIFMPCFASHNPAGMQVYLCTSFVFTTFQSVALRSEQFRSAVGLPPLNRPAESPKYGMQFVDIKKLEQKADELRGGGEVLGRGVLAQGFRLSFPGTKRESTIEAKGSRPAEPTDDSHLYIIKYFSQYHDKAPSYQTDPKSPFIHGISAPPEEMALRMQEKAFEKQQQEQMATLYFDKLAQGEQMSQAQMIEMMEKANKGERPIATEFVGDAVAPRSASSKPIRVKRIQKVKGRKKAKGATVGKKAKR